jgi:hypothetical protein
LAGKSITSGRYNSFLGYETGLNTDIGSNNIFLGFQAGLNNKGDVGDPGTGCNNIFIGNKSGFSNVYGFRNLYIGDEAGYLSEGYENTFIGNQAGYRNNGTSSTFIGYRAGYNSVYSDFNTFIGSNAGENNNDGMSNVFVGVASGMNNIVGSQNVFVGNAAGAQNGAGSDNVAIGYSAGQTGNDGRGNVLIGYSSGYKINGNGNITLGYYAGYYETGANRLYIANTCGTNLADTKNKTLIYGEFDNKLLTFNAKVGIGTLAPSQSLEIVGTDSKIYLNSAASNMLLYNSSGVAEPSFTTRSAGTKIVLFPGVGVSSTDFAIGIESNNIWYSVPRANSTYSHKFYGGTTELMRIRGDGYVGIGTTSPETKLHVNPGQVTLDGSSNPYVRLNNGPYQGYLEITGSNLALTHAGTVRLAITPLGMVGIGTTSPGSYRLYVSGSAYSTGGWAGSDVRWKKNISGISMILDEISQLNPVYYEWKKEDFPEMSFDSGSQIGLIAQEVEKVFPELVKTNEDGYKAVSYEKLTVVLLEGMKEQQQQIDELKAMVEKLLQKQ